MGARNTLLIGLALLALIATGCGRQSSITSDNNTTPANFELTSITLSSGTLSPTFTASTSAYTATVTNSVSSITVIPTANNSSGTIKVNGADIVSSNASSAVILVVGTNSITIEAIPTSGTSKTYTIVITRQASMTAEDYYLEQMVLSEGSLSPNFTTGQIEYSITVTNSVSSIILTLVASGSGGSLEIDGGTVGSGKKSSSISLNVGTNTITIIVKGPKGKTITYQIKITREKAVSPPPEDVPPFYLTALTLSQGSLSPNFDTNTTSYTATVTNSAASIMVTPTAAGKGGNIKVNGKPVKSGEASDAILLIEGANTITIDVKKGNDTTTYTVTITRQAAPPADAYYVATTGSDSTGNGSQSNPWKTIQYGINQLVAGKTLYVESGTYNESLNVGVSGNSGSVITIAGASGATVNIKGMEFAKGTEYVNASNFHVAVPSGAWGVFLRGTNQYITLDGFNISGGDAGIHMTWGYDGQAPTDGPVSNITIKNSVVGGSLYTAIDGTPGPCNNMTLQNLEAYGSGQGNPAWGSDGIAIEKGQNILVENCYVHDNAGDGIDLNSRDYGGNAIGIVVRNNRSVKNMSTGLKIWSSGTVEGNVIWGNWTLPLVAGFFDGTLKIINNTIAYNMYHSSSTRNYAALIGFPYDVGKGDVVPKVTLTMANNIFAYNSTAALGGVTGLYLGTQVTLVSEKNNLYYSQDLNEIECNFTTVGGDNEVSRTEIKNGTWTTATGQGSGDVVKDPKFVSGWPNVDLHLKNGSPAKDAGVSAGQSLTDLAGTSRPQGSGYDIGAYEQ